MGAWFRFVGWLAVIVGLALALIHFFLLEAWRVPTDDPMLGASVEPTLSAGDWVLVWRGGSFSRGNLLRCPDPQAPGRYVIARAIGAPYDRVRIQGERVSLDGLGLPSPSACSQIDYPMLDPSRHENVDLTCTVEAYGDRDFSTLVAIDHPEPPTQVQVGMGKWFLVSDNRHIHVDSRDYGPIDATPCRHIVFRLVGAGGINDEKKRLTVVW